MNNPPSSLFFGSAIEDATDQAFMNIAREHRPELEAARRHVDELWKIYGPYADSQFPYAIRRRFHERYWEMYLTCTLIARGCDVQSLDYGPDILLELGDGSKVWIEAVSPTPGERGRNDSVPERKFEPSVVTSVPADQILLRFRSSIADKEVQRLEFIRRGIVAPHDAYVLAINSRQIPQALFDTVPPFIIQAVYPIGRPVATFHCDSDRVDWSYQFRASLIKASGAPVSTDLFMNEEYSGVSAVLHSHVDAANHPSELGMDFKVVHNLNASFPLRHGLLGFGQEWVPVQEGENINLRNTGVSS